MRTTIRLDDELLKRAKRHAQLRGKTLTQLIEEALRETVERRDKPQQRRKPVRLMTAGEGGLLPGVDLDDSDSLMDVMEDNRHVAG